MSLGFSLADIVSQAFFVFHEIDIFEDYRPVIFLGCPHDWVSLVLPCGWSVVAVIS
jgi:hypothetical protein